MKPTILLPLAAALLLLTAPARAVTVDLGILPTPPPVPDLTVVEGSPYYITNTAQPPAAPADPADPGVAAPATADVVEFRVGSGVAAHVGYGPAAVADESITLNVQNNLSVAGQLNLGSAETTKAITVNVAGDMVVDGGRMAANGGTAAAADPGAGGGGGGGGGGGAAAEAGVTIVVTGDASIANGSLTLASSAETAPATLTARRILVGSGGNMTLSGFATATTTGTTPAPPAGGVAEPYYAVVVSGGGVLTLDGGVQPAAAPADPAVPPDPAAPADPAWVFRGIDVSAGGDGLLVESGGVLAAGAAGGTIKGAAWPVPADPTVPATGPRLLVRKGGSLDASRGVIQVQELGGVTIEGNYTAGYNATSGITLLEADASRVDIAATAEIGMSRDLQRHINSLELPPTIDTAGILRGGEIVFESGVQPTLRTGMGTYSMNTAKNTDGIDILYVGKAENSVVGSGLAHDRTQFKSNMDALWNTGGLNASQADVIYDLAAAARPTITTSGPEGEANRAALEAFVSGPGTVVGSRGVADAGLYELYTGAAQYGPNAVAYGAAAEVLSGLRRRVDFLEEELLRSEGGASGMGMASYVVPEMHANRVWAGGFGRNEEAERDSGIAGYEYKQSGVIAGYDKIYGDSLVVGGAVAMGDGDFTDFAATSGNSEIATYSVGGYVALRRWTGFSATGYGSYSLLKNELDDIRGGLRRRAEYDSAAWTLGGRLGYDLYPAAGLKVTPSVGLERIHAVSREHSEIIDDLALIRVGDITRDSTVLPFEVAATFDLLRWEGALLRLNTTLGYAYDLSSGGMDGEMSYQGLVGAGPVAAADRELGRNRFNFGAGLQFSGTKLDVDATYNYYTRDSYKAHQFQGNLGVKF